MRQYNDTWRAWWTAGSLCASGCAFSVDGDLIKSGDASVVAEEEGGKVDDDDGGDPAPETDARVIAAEDTGVLADDGGVEPPAVGDASLAHSGCTEDSDCGADEYCTRAGSCVARCDDVFGCAGPHSARPESVTASAEKVYWSTAATTSVNGVSAHDGSIWSWDLHAEPVKLTSGLAVPELVSGVDERLYFLDFSSSATDLYRVQASGPSLPELVHSNVRVAWSTDRFLYWSAGNWTAAEAVELWRLERTSAGVKAMLAAAMHQGWVGGSDEVALHSEGEQVLPDTYGVRALVADELPGLTSHHELLRLDVGGTDWPTNDIVMAGTAVFFAEPHYQVELLVLDMTEPGESQSLVRSNLLTVSHFLQGGWLYWSRDSLAGGETIFGRTQSTAVERSQELLRLPFVDSRSGSAKFAVLGSRLVYWDSREERLFVADLPPIP